MIGFPTRPQGAEERAGSVPGAGRKPRARPSNQRLQGPQRCNHSWTGQQQGQKDVPSSPGNCTSAAPRKREFANNVLQIFCGSTHCIKGEGLNVVSWNASNNARSLSKDVFEK